LLFHYGFTCRSIYNLTLHQRNLSRDPNPVRIMNKIIKCLCWIAVIVILYGCGSTSQTPPAVEEPQETRQKKNTTLYLDLERLQWYDKGNPKKNPVYVGEIRKGVPHGKGTFTLSNGEKYVGEWQDGLMHGQGTHTLPDGAKYVGEWQDNKQHGQGTLTFPDGGKYVGEFKDNEPWKATSYDKDGNVVITYSNGVMKAR